ncbi:MAG: tetratricopeptide repeat protein, partial [Cyanobacteria bacterium P01_E01_bin.34]
RQFDEAIVSFQTAIELEPNCSQAYGSLGICLQAKGELERAMQRYEQALTHDPSHPTWHNNLGNVLKTQHQYSDAIRRYQQGLGLNPDNSDLWVNLGSAFQAQGKITQAIETYQTAIHLHPSCVAAHNNLGSVFQAQNRFEDAIRCYQTVLELAPDFSRVRAQDVICRRSICEWEGLAERESAAIAAARSEDWDGAPWPLLAITDDPALHLAAARRFRRNDVRGAFPALWQGERHQHDKIRLAYLSADFHDHATAYLMAELFERHDRERFEITAISFGPDCNGAMRQRLIGAFDRYLDVRSLPNKDVACQMRELEIDIAIDLKGYTSLSRPQILAYRPAPIQVSYLGYPGSMGADFMDYILVDPFIVPPSQQGNYSEQLVHLPDCYQVNDSQRAISKAVPARRDCGLPETGFVFCSFNSSYKIEPTCFDIWMRLLSAVPNSVLWLMGHHSAVAQNLRKEARNRRVDPSRLVFATRQPLADHLARHQLADLFLDSWPCGAHTTASDALWAGLPVLTYAGRSFASRVAGSLLASLGLPELVTQSWEDYEAIALELATHPETLQAIQDKLRRNRETSPLFDCDRFRRHLESAYTTMWTRWQQGQAPAAFAVEASDSPQNAEQKTPTPATTCQSSSWIDQQLNQAERYLQAGQLFKAVQRYQHILEQFPDAPQAHAKLADIFTTQAQRELALSHAQQWVRLQPKNSHARNCLGLAHQQLNQLDSAIEQYRAAIALQPNYPQVHSRMGSAYKASGDLEAAIVCYRRALHYKPNYPQALNNLGRTLSQIGQLDEAIACYRQALDLKPDYVKALNSLGLALQEQGHHQEALDYHHKALDIAPNDPQAQHNLGLALHAQGQLEAAVRAHHQALNLDPNYQKAHNNLGVILQELGQHELAMQHYRTALDLQPDNPHALNNLGSVLQTQGQLTEAIAHYRQAIALQPDYPQALTNLAIVLQAQGTLSEALERYRQVIALQPDFPGALVPYFFCRRSVCDWRGLEADATKVIAAAGSNTWDASPWKLLAIADRPDLQLAAARSYCRNRLMTSTPPIWQGEFYQHDKIRLAYLSADFHDHATAYLMAELFEQHDRERFEITAISFGPDSSSAMRQRLVNAFDRFIDVRHLSNLDAARQLRKLEIDIAIDLKGYTRDARTQILAHRPAPIQVSYLGHPGSMGADFIDYILVDLFIVPPDQQPYFSEQLVHLPDCYQVNDGTRAIADDTPTRSECGLPETGFVFCSFNNSYKLEPTCFSIWMRLLNAVPHSVLWLLKSNAWMEENLRREAKTRGVNPDRLVFADKLPLPQHLARHRLADLFLDSWPCCAHTTASDALWTGLPLLTYSGQSFASRVAGSLLHAMGLPELVTHTWDDYESLAFQLATQPQRLQQLRDRLERNREVSPLFDCKRFCHHLEAAYKTMWTRWQQGKSPQAFTVTPVAESGLSSELAKTAAPPIPPPQEFVITELHRGLDLIRSGQLELAETCLDAVLACQPECFDAWQLLGAVALKQQQPKLAQSRLLQALEICPTSAEAHSNLGLALREQGQLPEAISQFHLAVQHNPQFPDVFNNLGLALREHGQPQDAMRAYRQAIALKPDYGDAITNLAKLYQDRGELAEAVRSWKTVLNLWPQQPEALLNYVYCRRLMCDWQGLQPMQQAAIEASTNAPTTSGVWYLLGMTDDPDAHWQAARHYVRHRFGGDYLQLWQGEPYQHARIRLAYLSADFHEHATAYLMAELFEQHDRQRFEVVAISYGPKGCSPMRQRLEQGFDRFVDVSSLSDRQAAELIRELEIDIAIDLKGYTKCERTSILAYRPAPIQVSYLGYPSTMGTDFIDYIVVDPFVVPNDQQSYFSERLVHLPDCYQVNDSQREIATHSLSRQDCGLPERGFVFCSFNNAYKLAPDCFDVWMRLLQRVPDSVIWLLESNVWMVENLRQEASRRDINPDRLIFAPRLPSPEHLARQPLVDLFLDSWPYGAHTTTSDALRMGLPVVTLTGRSFASRVAGSLLHAMGLPELATSSWEDYEAIAYQLARQPEAMRAVRTKLENCQQTSPLFNCDRFRHHIESAYETMWSRWQDGHSLQGVRVQLLSSASPKQT